MALHKKLLRLKRAIRGLGEKQLLSLDAFLHKLITEAKAKAKAKARAKAEVLEERKTPKGTFRLQKVRCGKPGCKCESGKLHGPYWYRFWSEGGRTRSEYIGLKR